MMCKRMTALLLLLAALWAHMPTGVAEANHYALLYDDPSSGTMRLLREMMLYSSWNCEYLSLWEAEALSGYDAVILCVGEDRRLSDAQVEALQKIPVFVIGGGGVRQLSKRARWFEGDVMLRCDAEDGESGDLLLNEEGLWLLSGHGEALGGEVFVDGIAHPLCQRRGNLTHFAYFDPQVTVLCAQLAQALQLWQWPYDNAPTAYGEYVVLDCVYPFLNPAELMKRTDMLREEGLPYALALTPIFSNAEYPAMKRFCEFLRYQQSQGAGLVLRVPFVSISQVDLDDLIHAMKVSYEAYASYGVYPLAVEAPEFWLECEKGVEALKGFRTVLLFETDESGMGETLHQNLAFRDGHQIIAPAWQDLHAFSSSYAQAIYLDAQMDVEEMRAFVQRFKNSKRVFKSLTELENTVYSGELAVESASGALRVNGKLVDTRYIPFTYEEDYTFDRGITQYFKKQIETSNQWLMLFVILACTVFLILIAMFRRQVRRELLRGQRGGKTKEKKGEQL